MPLFKIIISFFVSFYFVNLFALPASSGASSNTNMDHIREQIESANTALSKPAPCEVCNIGVAGAGSEDFSFETENSCREKSQEKRLYFRNELKMMPDILTRTRNPKDSSAEFPRECVTYIMRHGPGMSKALKGRDPGFYKKKGQIVQVRGSYAKCEPLGGEPTRTAWPLCVTEEYVNSVYNTFTDVFSCFGISQKKLLPKMMQESGMHVNTLGSANEDSLDAGIGQLTYNAHPRRRDIKLMQATIEQNQVTNPACARVQKTIEDITNKIDVADTKYQTDTIEYRRLLSEYNKNEITYKKDLASYNKKLTSYKKAVNHAKAVAKRTHTEPQFPEAPVAPTEPNIPLKPSQVPSQLDLMYFVGDQSRETRCELLEPPKNPFLNVFYIAAYMMQTDDVIDANFKNDVDVMVRHKLQPKKKKKTHGKTETTDKLEPTVLTEYKTMSLEKMLEMSYGPNAKNDEIISKIKEMVNTQSYNIGAITATNQLKSYIKIKLASEKKIKASDFNFHVNQKKVSRSALVKRDEDLTYPEFCMKHPPLDKDEKPIGSPAYLIQMAGQADRLNKVFLPGKCTPEKYLQL